MVLSRRSSVKNNKIVKKTLILSGLFIVLLGLLTSDYWLKQINFLLSSNEQFVANGSSTNGSSKIQPNMVIIESLRIKAPIVFVSQQNEKVFQEGLKNGVVHYPGTAQVGQNGNAYIFGHSSDHVWKRGNYKTVFALLPKIKVGEKITASDSAGNAFTYTVIRTFVASAKDTYLLGQYNNEKKILTLQTSYPIGTALKRFIVIAEIKS